VAVIVAWVFVTVVWSCLTTVKYLTMDEDERDLLIFQPQLLYPAEAYRYFIVPVFGVALMGNFLLYWRIAVAVAVQRKRTNKTSTTRKERLNRMVLVLLTVLLLSWIPLSVYIFVPQPQEPGAIRLYWRTYNIFTLCNTVPSFANAFIYAGQQKDFHAAYKALFTCKSPASVGVQDTGINSSGNATARSKQG
jgi:hypothetical protein